MRKPEQKSIVISIYTHPELYPPLLNSIDELGEVFRNIVVLSRNLLISQWNYPATAKLVVSGRFKHIHSSESASISWKILSFFRYTKAFYRALRQARCEWVMCNDPISLFSFRIIRPFIGFSVKLWYHSHDVAELKSVRKFSVGYFAIKSEHTYFRNIDLFTLPSPSRLKFLPVDLLKGKTLIVPNYPSLKRMQRAGIPNSGIETGLKLLYQGRVSDEHGLEQMIDFVKTDNTLRLTIIGPGNESYIAALKDRIVRLNVTERISLLDPVPYGELQAITWHHHVGLAVNKPVNVLYSTAALASNKIYEYAAAGLPILYYKNEHYVEQLGKYSWAFPTDLSFKCLKSQFEEIRDKYSALSDAAITDFKNELNFEVAFNPVLSHIFCSNEGI